MIQAHHEKRGVDIADDHRALDLVAPVVTPPRELVEGCQTLVDPAGLMRAGLGNHPVADGQGVIGGSQFCAQRGQEATGPLSQAIVNEETLALDFGDAEQGRMRTWRGEAQDLLDDGRLQAEPPQPIEMRRVDHGSLSCMTNHAARKGRYSRRRYGPSGSCKEVVGCRPRPKVTASRRLAACGRAGLRLGGDLVRAGRQKGNGLGLHGGLLR